MQTASWKAEMWMAWTPFSSVKTLESQVMGSRPSLLELSHGPTHDVLFHLLASSQMHLITQWDFRSDERINRSCLC